jgi:3-hydroxyisobutyrate dehydrogenase-like beta-hydroxyacid dehydrogenase
MNVGFIGLGHMGAGMAANLLRAGHEVTVYNPRRARRDRWSSRVRGPPLGYATPAAAMPSSPCSQTTPLSRRSCSGMMACRCLT